MMFRTMCTILDNLGTAVLPAPIFFYPYWHPVPGTWYINTWCIYQNANRRQLQINALALLSSRWMKNNEEICIIMQTLLYFAFFLVAGCRDYLPVAFCTCELNVTHLCSYAIRQTPSPRYVYPIPVYWPRLRNFLIPVWFRWGVPHTFPLTNSGISNGAVKSVVGELISVQAAQNRSNRGRPKTKTHDPHHPQNKQNGEEKNAVRVALYLATSKTSQTNKTLHIYNVYQALTVQEYTW